MSDLFQPIAQGQLFEWVFSELESRNTLFGIPRRHFYTPSSTDPLQTSIFNHRLETPFGPASGPHTQMAQNIIAAWLCGARYMELKTVQTIDELNVSKPCIDMEDEGYNVEWSQELKVHQSFDEYLRAWVLIHALHHWLGFPGDRPGMVFNLSVGYNLEGIKKPNMQWFLDQAHDCSVYKQQMIEEVARFYPAVRELDIPDCMSDNVTLSTMHGCPPDEIGSICSYLLKERGLHTFVKCNPTLLGPDKVRDILQTDLGYNEVTVPDEAFGHDLKYSDAVPLIGDLMKSAEDLDLQFGVKLTNTLEVANHRRVFDDAEKMMYLSGRPLHAISVNLASKLSNTFDGHLPMSFCAGVDCFNAANMLASGMQTVTVCSDLLKTGGYMRMLQYVENAHSEFDGVKDIDEFILRSAGTKSVPENSTKAAQQYLARYAEQVCSEPLLKKDTFLTSKSKTTRPLGLFDCIEAPCTDRCAVNQAVPQYMKAVREGDVEKAVIITRHDNPVPAMLGRVCDHLCEPACVRTHLDEPVAIRHIKRFIMDLEKTVTPMPGLQKNNEKVAIIGAGPGGMAAASELAAAGYAVEIFEQQAYAGGMVGGAIPAYRLPTEVVGQDLARLGAQGVKIHFSQSAGRDFSLWDLRRNGFAHIAIMVGAQLGKKLGLVGESAEGVMDALEFLRKAREGRPAGTGRRIGIIGAGDTAMDCARTAWRLSGGDAKVSVIYRRSIDQMPADREEVACLLEEGIEVVEMAKPEQLLVSDGKLQGLVCQRMEYRGDRDASGRKVPHVAVNSQFEIELDTLILAISQHAVLDFFKGMPVALNPWGYIEVDQETFETSIPGVYSGGDVVNDGPSSIVEAAADGKAIASSIIQGKKVTASPSVEDFDTSELLQRRSHREWRVPVPHTSLGNRKNFNEVVQGYNESQARNEASRCLDCDTYCSLCVGVCPNLALQTWRMAAFDVQLPLLARDNGQLVVTSYQPFQVDQAFQIAVMADLCNECGNCVTFCPTAGEPYRDKPRLYIDRVEFEAESNNAFMLIRNEDKQVMEARFDGETHRIEVSDSLMYLGPSFQAQLNPADFSVDQLIPTDEMTNDHSLSLEPCATMYALLVGLNGSLPFMPVAPGGDGCIPHPEYGSGGVGA